MYSYLNMYDAKRIVVLLILLVVSLCCFLLPKNCVSKVGGFFLLFFGLGLVSCLYSRYPGYAFSEWGLFLLLGLGALGVSSLVMVFSDYAARLFLVGVLIVSGYYCYTVVVGVVASLLGGGVPVWPLPIYGFSNIRFFNQAHLAVFFWILISPFALNWARFSSFILCVIGALWVAFLIYSVGRGETLAAMGGMLVILCLGLSITNIRRAIPVMLLILLAGVAMALYYMSIFDVASKTERLANMGDSARIILWKQALNLWWEHPFIGVGPMHFAAYPNPIAAHPHNGFLQILSEWGGIAFVLMLVMIVILLKTQWKVYLFLRRNRDSSFRRGAIEWYWLAALLTWLSQTAYAQVSGVWVMPLSQMGYALNLGMLVGLSVVIAKNYGAQSVSEDIGESSLESKPEFRILRDYSRLILLSLFLMGVGSQVFQWVRHWDWVKSYNEAGFFGGVVHVVPGPRYFLIGGIPAPLETVAK